jgi:UDP-GlcNAc:undecaprenyl-phosphate GlcNAc-1-phosphate transferase
MREYALAALVAAVVTYLTTPVVRRCAVAWGAVAAVRERDVHSVPTPRLGGVAMFLGLSAGLLVARHTPVLHDVLRGSAEPRGVFWGGLVICAVGVVDDRWGLDAFTKLAGQICAAGVMVTLGVQLSYAVVPGVGAVSISPDMAVPVTVLLVVIIVNAVNFVDGLDGLAAGVVGIAALGSFAYSYILLASLGVLREAPGTMLAAVLVGVCAGFLPHNFSPARLFMGDSGSMLIGLVLAGAVTSAIGQVDAGSLRESTQSVPFLVPLLIPVAVLALPFLDLAMAVVRRTLSGKSPFAPDKLHLHHRLLEIGHSTRRAVLLMYVWSALVGLGAVALFFSSGPLLVLAGLGVVAVLAGGAVLLPRWRRPRGVSS